MLFNRVSACNSAATWATSRPLAPCAEVYEQRPRVQGEHHVLSLSMLATGHTAAMPLVALHATFGSARDTASLQIDQAPRGYWKQDGPIVRTCSKGIVRQPASIPRVSRFWLTSIWSILARLYASWQDLRLLCRICQTGLHELATILGRNAIRSYRSEA